MENPGLVTYDADIILSPPGEDTVRHPRVYTSIAAHELAHQWTGDMVTMKWWNDVWLNEIVCDLDVGETAFRMEAGMEYAC
jgi:cytosol alanyl aminopeptidase